LPFQTINSEISYKVKVSNIKGLQHRKDKRNRNLEKETVRNSFVKMFGTFPEDFFQKATSQGYFPKWQLPKRAFS